MDVLYGRRPRREAIRHILGVLITGALLSGCVTVDVANDPTLVGEGQAKGVPYASAMTYLHDARVSLVAKAQTYEKIDTGTKIAVGVGAGGAAIGSLFAHAADPVVGSVTLAALGYAANRDINPAVLAAVYRAGANNLECVRSAAVLASQDVEAIRTQMGPASGSTVLRNDIATQIDKLRGDINAAEAKDAATASGEMATNHAADINNAVDEINTAWTVLKQVDALLSTASVGDRVVSNVNGTLQLVNRQALSKSPSVDAIWQSRTVLSDFLGVGAQLRSNIQAAKQQLSANTISAGDAETNALVLDLRKLNRLVAMVPSLNIQTDLDSISQCKPDFGVLTPVTVSPSPVTLTAGGDAVKLTLTGTGPFTIHWDPANAPKSGDITFSNTVNPPTLKADAKAATGSFVFHVSDDSSGVDSANVNLTVQAAAAAAPAQGQAQPAQAQPAQAQPAAKPDGAPPAAPARNPGT